MLDDRARSEFRARVQAIEEGLEEARSFNDLGRIERLEQERDAILAELRVATGLGGRSRKLKDPSERAKQSAHCRGPSRRGRAFRRRGTYRRLLLLRAEKRHELASLIPPEAS
jgi:hypothetical protein